MNNNNPLSFLAALGNLRNTIPQFDSKNNNDRINNFPLTNQNLIFPGRNDLNLSQNINNSNINLVKIFFKNFEIKF